MAARVETAVLAVVAEHNSPVLVSSCVTQVGLPMEILAAMCVVGKGASSVAYLARCVSFWATNLNSMLGVFLLTF